ncbi:MAG TPA: ABC transporter permease [Candidatus Dormibacteraeota bacterium]|nr:ABC transporter permease [Candidatus Dormibacteraeota bacterium]
MGPARPVPGSSRDQSETVDVIVVALHWLTSSAHGASSVFERDLRAQRRQWPVVLSGFFEPLFYLLSLGVGVGALVHGMKLPDGRVVGYAAFVAPAMLAASAMNGAISESTFNVYGKLTWAKLYDGVMATPVAPVDVALGEIGWALARGLLYAAAFLALMAIMGLTRSWWAVLALPAAVLVGLAFAAIGMTFTTYVRAWQDFDWSLAAIFVMFLFSGTFAPISAYPLPVQLAVLAMPLSHGVELIRGLTTGSAPWTLLGHAAYLLAVAGLGLAFAGRRMTKLLYK